MTLCFSVNENSHQNLSRSLPRNIHVMIMRLQMYTTKELSLQSLTTRNVTFFPKEIKSTKANKVTSILTTCILFLYTVGTRYPTVRKIAGSVKLR